MKTPEILMLSYELVGKELVPVPEQQDAIARIRELRAGGRPLRAVQAQAPVKLSPEAISRICNEVEAP